MSVYKACIEHKYSSMTKRKHNIFVIHVACIFTDHAYICPMTTPEQTPRRKLSEAAKASLSARRKGQNNPNAKYIYIINGKRFESLAAATDFYNLLNKSNLSSRTVQRKCLKQVDFCYTLLKKTLK